MREQRKGNELRESSAPMEQSISDNLPGLLPVSRWTAHYWVLDADGRLQQGRGRLNILPTS